MKKRTKYLFASLCILLLPVTSMFAGAQDSTIIAAYSTTIPTIDGNSSSFPGEWDDATEHIITLESSDDSVRFKHDGTYIYALLKVKDATTNDFIDATSPHDWTGIDFDRNGDMSTMGSADSPDDVALANWMISGGEDWWMTGQGRTSPRGDDVSSGGTNDVVASYGGSIGGYTYWEFRKALNSGDTAGYDISLDPESDGYGLNNIYIMFAYQQSQPVGKRHASCSPWYLLHLEAQPAPVGKHDVAVDAISAPTDAVEGDTVSISVDISNPGDFDESFDVQVSYDASIIETRSVFLSAKGSGTELFSWDTTGVASATYTLTAEAILVGDEDTTNNVKTTTISINPPPPPTAKFADLIKRSAWPERHHFDISAEADRGNDAINTLYAIIKKDSLSDTPTTAKVEFAIYQSIDKVKTWKGNLSTAEVTLNYAGHEKQLDAAFDTTVWELGKYYVVAQVWYDSDCNGTIDKAGETKKFSFTIVQ